MNIQQAIGADKTAQVAFYAKVTAKETEVAKTGSLYVQLTLEDCTGLVVLFVFPESPAYGRAMEILPEAVVYVHGSFDASGRIRPDILDELSKPYPPGVELAVTNLQTSEADSERIVKELLFPDAWEFLKQYPAWMDAAGAGLPPVKGMLRRVSIEALCLADTLGTKLGIEASEQITAKAGALVHGLGEVLPDAASVGNIAALYVATKPLGTPVAAAAAAAADSWRNSPTVKPQTLPALVATYAVRLAREKASLGFRNSR